MKFLKTQNLSKWSISDNTYIQNTYGRVTIDSTNSLRLPKGTTAQRPNTSLIPNLNGAIRYNTDSNSIEGYIGGAWETIRAPASAAIRQEQYGPGDFVETKFGPMRTDYASAYTASANNIIVLVENVMQIPTTNFTIVQNPAGTSSPSGYLAGAAYPAGYYLSFTDAVPIGKSVTVFYGYGN